MVREDGDSAGQGARRAQLEGGQGVGLGHPRVGAGVERRQQAGREAPAWRTFWALSWWLPCSRLRAHSGDGPRASVTSRGPAPNTPTPARAPGKHKWKGAVLLPFLKKKKKDTRGPSWAAKWIQSRDHTLRSSSVPLKLCVSGKVWKAPPSRRQGCLPQGEARKELLQGQDSVFLESPERPEIGASPSSRRGPPARIGSGSGSGTLSLVSGHWGPGGKHSNGGTTSTGLEAQGKANFHDDEILG